MHDICLANMFFGPALMLSLEFAMNFPAQAKLYHCPGGHLHALVHKSYVSQTFGLVKVTRFFGRIESD